MGEAIRDFMKKGIIFVKEEDKIIEAIKKMVEHDIGSVIVKKGDEFVGIITERDILKRCYEENIYSPDINVGKIMSSPLITIEASAPLEKAIKVMQSSDIRRLLVEEDGKIVGIITSKDILRETAYLFMALQSRD